VKIFKLDCKPNKLDILIHFLIGASVGYYHGWALGVFAFSVVSTLDQILWVMAGTLKDRGGK